MTGQLTVARLTEPDEEISSRLFRMTAAKAGEICILRFDDKQIADKDLIVNMFERVFPLVDHLGKRRIILDFVGVTYVSSSALNHLILLDKRLNSHGGQLRLCTIDQYVYQVFAITRLNQLFDIKHELTHAIHDPWKPLEIELVSIEPVREARAIEHRA